MPIDLYPCIKTLLPQTWGVFQNGDLREAQKHHLLHKFNEVEKTFIRVCKSSWKQTNVFTTQFISFQPLIGIILVVFKILQHLEHRDSEVSQLSQHKKNFSKQYKITIYYGGGVFSQQSLKTLRANLLQNSISDFFFGHSFFPLSFVL